jgi:hypothetical protein
LLDQRRIPVHGASGPQPVGAGSLRHSLFLRGPQLFYGACNDTLIEALPTCVGSDNPPRYEPITNGDYQRWFRNRNYASYTGEEAGPEAP